MWTRPVFCHHHITDLNFQKMHTNQHFVNLFVDTLFFKKKELLTIIFTTSESHLQSTSDQSSLGLFICEQHPHLSAAVIITIIIFLPPLREAVFVARVSRNVTLGRLHYVHYERPLSVAHQHNRK